jgi:K+-transporting ATPase ATPase C chain
MQCGWKPQTKVNMRNQIRPAIVSIAIFTLLTGIFYPLVITGIAQLTFPHKANGSLIVQNSQVLGSELIGQQFDDPRYFWGRLSATAPFPYNAAASTGSNLGPMNQALTDQVSARIADLKAADPINDVPIPVDLVTASGSGLDPDISIAAAQYQIRRVATARGLREEVVRSLIESNTQKRLFGVLGEPRVNVLELNLALDEIQ